MSCPTNEELERFALGFADDASAAQKHVEACDACAAALKSLKGDHEALARGAKAVALPRIPARRSWWRPVAAAASVLLTTGAFLLVLSLRQQEAEEVSVFQGIGKGDPADLYGGRRGRTPAASPAPQPTPSPTPAPQPHYFTKMPSDKPSQSTPLPPSATPEPAPPPPDPWTATYPPRFSLEARDLLDQAKIRQQRGDLSGAIHDYTRAIELRSDLGVAYRNRAEARRKLGDIAGAEADLRRADMIFKSPGINPEVDTSKETTSTFGLDVDTASYSKCRDFLKRGELPPPDAVRVEEFLNYFRYQDDPPPSGTFAIRLEAAPSPYDKGQHLLRIGIRAKDVKAAERKDVVLTLIIDVSGSMAQNGRLELVKKAIHILVERLRPTDRIGVVTFTNYSRKLIDHTPVAEKDKILAVIDPLHPQQSTDVSEGLKLGYELAAAGFNPKATNRVILFSDGVANTGDTVPESMLDAISKDSQRGIWLTVIGVGMGNYNDHILETLANRGNGNYAYVDDLAEAKRLFIEKLTGMMEVLAIDAKVQVEFDASTVAAFRLVGYENRHIANEDFRNDKVDAGEVGPGHHVTALYEFKLKPDTKGRLVTVRIRYKESDTKEVPEEQHSISVGQVIGAAKDASPSWRLAVAVMQFAEILRGSPKAKDVKLDAVLELAQKAAVDLDKPADVTELVELVKGAGRLVAQRDLSDEKKLRDELKKYE